MPETCRPVWPEYSTPVVTYGLPYHDACAKHIKGDLKASRVYIVISKSLYAMDRDYLDRLEAGIGKDSIAGVRLGMKPHSMYSEICELAQELGKLEADCLITIGGGSLIDSGKCALLASCSPALLFTTTWSGFPYLPLRMHTTILCQSNTSYCRPWPTTSPRSKTSTPFSASPFPRQDPSTMTSLPPRTPPSLSPAPRSL